MRRLTTSAVVSIAVATAMVACASTGTTQGDPAASAATSQTATSPAVITASVSGAGATNEPGGEPEDVDAPGTGPLVIHRGSGPKIAEQLPPVVVEEVPRRGRPDPGDSVRSRNPETTPKPIDRVRKTITGFEESTREPQQIPAGLQPYQYGVVSPVPFGRVDSTGVRVFLAPWDGKIYDHPIAQAQYALAALESYRLTGEQEYLDVALKNAQRIVDRKQVIDDAWYFPYDFDFDLYRNNNGVLTAPWASGMASGQALSTFVRLHEVTGDQKWREAADRAFAAFRQAPDGAGYFSSFIDDEGLLWLEEYSRYPVMDSERVLNGHMWSIFGIWDYWMMNDYDHPEAEKLFRGAMYTVEKTGMREFRNPGWASFYSIWHKKLGITYHQHHQQQFLMLYRMTHDSVWVSRATTFRSDYPEWRNTTGRAVLTPQVTQVYRLDDTATHINDRTMEILETKTVTIPSQTGADYDRRGKIPGGPNVIRLSSGWLKGWWVEERIGHAWSRQFVEEHRYEPDAQLYVDQDRSLAIYRYSSAGDRLEGKVVTLRAGTYYPTDLSAYTEGRPAYHLSGGPHAGWWLPVQSTVKVHRNPGWRVD